MWPELRPFWKDTRYWIVIINFLYKIDAFVLSVLTIHLSFLFPSFQEHRTEIDARAGTFHAFEQFGQQLLVRGHYASPEIQQKLEALDRERADLEKAWVQRRMMLDQCLELQVLKCWAHGMPH